MLRTPAQTVMLIIMLAGLAPASGALVPEPSGEVEKPHDGGEVVAIVGDRFVSQRDVELSWTAAYERIEDLVRRNKIRPAERHQRLQKEWGNAIERVVQEQLIFQEATRERRRQIERLVRLRASTEDSSALARREIVMRVRIAEDRLFGQYRGQVVQDAGGWKALQRILDRHGQTRAEWEEKLREQFIVRGFLALHVGAVRISPRAIKEYYEAHLKEFWKPEEVRFREILLRRDRFSGAESYQKAGLTVQATLVSGQFDFAQVAKAVSHASSRRRGGIYVAGGRDFIRRGVHLAAVEKALNKLDPGEISPAIETDRGTYFLMLEQRRKGGARPLAEVQDQVERGIRNQALREKRIELFEKLRRKARVQIKNDRLPEKYRRALDQDFPEAQAGVAG